MEIEKDIEILEKFKNNEMQRDKLEVDSRCGGWKIGDIYKKLELNIAIQNILAEREQDKKRIQEFLKEIDNLIHEMRENGSQYWANRLEKLKENLKEEK